MKIVYDCAKQTTSYIPLSGAEIAEREAAAAAAEAARKAAEETPE